MSELTETRPSAVTPYERGIERNEVRKATLGRFLPANVLSSIAVFGVLLGGFPFNPLIIPYAVVPQVIGYGLGLGLLRKHLYPDADVGGRRSIVAGLVSPAAVFIFQVFAPNFDLVPTLISWGVIGLVMALTMFFAWLIPTPGLAGGANSPPSSARAGDGRHEWGETPIREDA